jgi:hypothetical protein
MATIAAPVQSARRHRLGITRPFSFLLRSNSSKSPSRWRLPPWSLDGRSADLHLHPAARPRRMPCAARHPTDGAESRIQHPVAPTTKASIYRCPRREALVQKGPAQTRRKGPKPSGAGDLAGCEWQKTMRVDTMVVAVAGRLGVVRLSGMRWRATTLMPLDPHDHGGPSKLRLRSAASGTAPRRALRVETPSAVHPQCEAVLECG